MDIELSRGFVAFPRGLTEWEWYTEPNTARVYFHLLLTANWQEKQWQGITIRPGQLVTSRTHLSEQLRLSVQQVRTALERLKATGYITVKTGSKYSVVTLIDYDIITGINRHHNRPATSDQPTCNQQITTTLPSIPSEPLKPSTTSPAGAQMMLLPTEILQEYEANIGHLPPRCKAELKTYVQKLGTAVVLEVLHKCTDLGGHSWAYVRKALEDAMQLDCHTVEEYQRRAPIGGSRAKGTRVDRKAPSGTDWLSSCDLGHSLGRLQKRKLPQSMPDGIASPL